MPSKDRLRVLFVSERSSVLGFFRRATGSSAMAEELTQETFLRLAATDVAALANPSAYLRRISVNLIADVNRSHLRRRLTEAEIDDLLDVPDPGADPEARLIARDCVDRVLTALAELPQRRRDIVLASRLDGVPHRELAKRYGISTRTVEIEISKALESCARCLLD
ncbi:RNA polymerase sigma factor [Ancylobacter oerskovii]|uniref:RNA polymerase sigma factor n=1 Tax=Ancylobacter oerskovii TaxID=459519 RepID=A0ABW4Z597_9HYPH|nr:sigma-70 family RNA polymerase sigma factor [Ancylobacter oerskovii]MBS7546477.1 sigma-70 family RNA polymerase sigma factor [Ancylobacter oerskovii]